MKGFTAHPVQAIGQKIAEKVLTQKPLRVFQQWTLWDSIYTLTNGEKRQTGEHSGLPGILLMGTRLANRFFLANLVYAIKTYEIRRIRHGRKRCTTMVVMLIFFGCLQTNRTMGHGILIMMVIQFIVRAIRVLFWE